MMAVSIGNQFQTLLGELEEQGKQFKSLLDELEVEFFKKVDVKNADGSWKEGVSVFYRLALEAALKAGQIEATASCLKDIPMDRIGMASKKDYCQYCDKLCDLENAAAAFGDALPFLCELEMANPNK